jgi:diadenosine tetraphosphate (Ap4A) HIT family hydrolase
MELWKPFADAFQTDALTLFKTDHWTVMVRKGQVTLGSLVLAANRNFVSAAELTRDEVLEFPQVVARLESALSNAFAFDKINYLCLMMTDRHYHFHVIPRYREARRFEGKEWTDADWPGPPNVAVPPLEERELIAIRDHLKQYI